MTLIEMGQWLSCQPSTREGVKSDARAMRSTCPRGLTNIRVSRVEDCDGDAFVASLAVSNGIIVVRRRGLVWWSGRER